MQTEKAFLVGMHTCSFRPGQPAEIMGVVFVTPRGLAPRACYKVRFEDGEEDYVAVSDQDNFVLIPEEDVNSKRVPPPQ